MDTDDEIEALREDAERRAALAWAELLQRLGANAPGSEAARINAAEARAIRLVCLMRVAGSKPSKERSRVSRWKDRARLLERLDEVLLDYVGGFPVGSDGDLPWSLAAREGATELRRHIRAELRWRRNREARLPTTPGVTLVEWSPTSRPGPKDGAAFAAIAQLANDYGIGARDLALLESLARLPGEPFGTLNGDPLLAAWDPAADDYLFLPLGEARFDAQLCNERVVKRWRDRLAPAR